jgi:hypothetical protein
MMHTEQTSYLQCAIARFARFANRARPRGLLVPVTAVILAAVVHSAGAMVNDAVIRQKKMAVMRLKVSGLSRDDAERYSMHMQIALTEVTGWEIMDYSVTESLLAERGGSDQCANLQCRIINGQLLGVDYLCFGSVETIGKTFSLNLQIADILTGRLVANVSRFYKGKEPNFVKKIIPDVAKQATSALVDKRSTAYSGSRQQSEVKDRLEKQAGSAFGDVRGYLAYGSDEGIQTEGKLAFGYLVTGRNIDTDGALRYSYQLQSYLADAGGCAMLYIDEMERLMQARGGTLQCGTKRCATNVGKLLGVNYMGFGRLKKIFGCFILRIYVVDVETGEVITRQRVRFRGSEIAFLTEVIPEAASRIGEVLEERTGGLR